MRTLQARGRRGQRSPALALLPALILVIAIAPTQVLAQPPPVDCVYAEEQQLASLVNDYRAQQNPPLPAIPISFTLMKVAHWHAWDLIFHNATGGSCNLHSWSNTRPWQAGVPDTWKPVCYDSTPASYSGMWDKPQEISGGSFAGNGYENSYWESDGVTPQEAFDGWVNSPNHNAMMLNLGIWESFTWRSMGVAVWGNFAVLWVSDTADFGPMDPCGGVPCTITDLIAGEQTACDPQNNTYAQQITVMYSRPPSSGDLIVNGQHFPIGTSPQLVTLTGLPADGAAVDAVASFSTDPGCNRTESSLFTAPSPCLLGTTVCAYPNVVIPDDDPWGIVSDIVVLESMTVGSVEVWVRVHHTYIGDLYMQVTHDGTNVLLHEPDGFPGQDIVGTYPTTLTPPGSSALTDFVGHSSLGNWELFIMDIEPPDVGTLVDWCIIIYGAFPHTNTEPAGRSGVVSILQSRPNPTRGDPTHLRFAIPHSLPVAVRLYDIRGRLVRNLYQGQAPAGLFEVPWDGRDEQGLRLAGGIYLYRLQTPNQQLTQKLVLLR